MSPPHFPLPIASLRTYLFPSETRSQNDTVYLENRIEAFLESLSEYLTELPPADFEKQKASLIENKLQSLKNLYEESARLWGAIQDGYFDFKKRSFLFLFLCLKGWID